MSKRARQLGHALVLTFIISGIAGCASMRSGGAPAATAPAVAPPATTAKAWPKIYTDAINDALNPEQSEVVNNLIPITQSNPLLVWKQFADGMRVLTVSLVGNASIFPTQPGAPFNTGAHDTWVTAVPEMRNACTQPGFSGGDLAMRLRQVVGLTPDATVTAFVEFWALPTQLFRPAADNDISDTTAGLIMPPGTELWYRTWFNQIRAQQYFQSTVPAHDAYPWTQLGYTYDWGTPEHHQGMSEFVIRQQSPVFVNGVTPYQAYCAPTTRER